MALSPEVEFDDIEDDSEVIETSQTYKIDFENGRITNEIITGLEAIKQFVYLSLHTERYAYSVYSHDIGNELQDVLADNETTDAYKKMEIPRLIEEALIYDDRVSSVSDFELEKQGDSFCVSFTVETDEGTLEIEEVLGEDV
ncbi:phage portal protein [Bacillus subtilis]|nr:phage portal protein [Bacillus subtilis]